MKNFEFDSVGKRMPYDVPEGFFDTLTQKTLDNVKAEQLQRKQKSATLRRYLFSSVAVAAALVVAIMLFVDSDKAGTAKLSPEENLEMAIESISDSEMDNLAIIAENDIFYDENSY